MIEVIFLVVLALVWLVFAAISDSKTTEIPNWLNFSLIIFALGFRFFYSLFHQGSWGFFYWGLIGLGIFFVLENVLYYSHAFAGGDAKLMMALGTILPFSSSGIINAEIFISFIFLFLAAGAVYGLVSSGYFAAKNFKEFRKEFGDRHRKFLKFSLPIMALGIIVMVFTVISTGILLYFGIIIFLLPLLYIYTKAVDEACMIRRRKPEQLMEGDWLYKDVKVGRKTIKADWNGLTKESIRLLKKKGKEVVIRTGIAFAPVFLISFLALVYFYFFNYPVFSGLWNSLW